MPVSISLPTLVLLFSLILVLAIATPSPSSDVAPVFGYNLGTWALAVSIDSDSAGHPWPSTTIK